MSPACLIVREPYRISHLGEQRYLALPRSWQIDRRRDFARWIFAWRSQ